MLPRSEDFRTRSEGQDVLILSSFNPKNPNSDVFSCRQCLIQLPNNLLRFLPKQLPHLPQPALRIKRVQIKILFLNMNAVYHIIFNYAHLPSSQSSSLHPVPNNSPYSPRSVPTLFRSFSEPPRQHYHPVLQPFCF